MNTQIALDFIDKTIAKTKSKQLNWNIIDLDSININPLSEEEIIDYYPMHTLSPKFSYYTNYQSGLLCLLTYKIDYCFNPPDGCSFSLRMQDHISRYSIEIATSSSDPTISAALVRLFNIIDCGSSSSSVMELIHNFLDS